MSSGVALEPSSGELVRVVELVGFELLLMNECWQTGCEYTGDSEAMLRWFYGAAFRIARKPVPSN